MLKTIVWATDGSENAERALPYAKALLAGDDTLLLAAHIMERPIGDTDATDNGSDDVVARTRELVSGVTERGIDATARIVSHIGQVPAHAIADVAREVHADAIVIGTRGHSPATGLIVGSVTQQLLSIAPCPVFAVPPSAATTDAERDVVATAGDSGSS